MSDIYKFFDDYLDNRVNDPVKSLKDFVTSSVPTPEQKVLSEQSGQPTPRGQEADLPSLTPALALHPPPQPKPWPGEPGGAPLPVDDRSIFEAAVPKLSSLVKLTNPVTAPGVILGSEFSKGVTGAVVGTVPTLTGDFVDAMGVLSDSSAISEVGRKVSEFGRANQKSFSPRVPSYTDIRYDSVGHTIDDAWDYAQGTAGGALGTSLPPLTLGLFAGIPGAATASFTLNAGDAYGSAKRDPEILALIESGALTPKTVAAGSMAAGSVMAALDVWGLNSILGGIARPYKQALAKQIIKGGLTEMGTETLQEVVNLTNEQLLGGDVKKAEAVERLINNAVGGLLGGGTMAGGANVLMPSWQEMMNERIKEVGGDPTPPAIKGIEALLRGEPAVAEGVAIPGEELAPANQNSIFENVEEDSMLVFGEYLTAEDAMRQAKFLQDIGRKVKTEEVPATDAARYNAAVERQVTRRGTRNAFRVIRNEAPAALPEEAPLASRSGGVVEPEVFYSQLQRTVEDKKFPAKGKGSDLLNKIKNSPGVKAEEIEWTGLESFLAGRESVTKEELREYLEENQVVVEEALYGTSAATQVRWLDPFGGNDVLSPARQARVIADALRTGGEVVDEYGHFRISRTPSGRIELRTSDPNEGEFSETYESVEQALTQAQARADTLIAGSTEGVGAEEGFAGAPKYGQYVLAGPRKKYRELLLKWAPPLTQPARKLQPLVEQYLTQAFDRQVGLPPEVGLASELVGRAEEQREFERYTEPHFGQDVLAWVRMTERVDESGQTILFIEELQSKWHQRGRAESYSQQFDVWELVNQEGEKLVDGDKETMEEELSRMQKAIPGRSYSIRKTGKKESVRGAVPNAPFKSSWLDLTFKRVLRYAADHGYSRVAWTTGEMQTERYGQHESTAPIANIYNKVLPPIARKWARTVGGVIGTTALRNENPNRFQVWDTTPQGPEELVFAASTYGEASTWLTNYTIDDEAGVRDNYEIREQPDVHRVPFVDLPDKVFREKPSFPLFKRTKKGEKRVVSLAKTHKLRAQTDQLLRAVDEITTRLGIEEDYTVFLLDDFVELGARSKGLFDERSQGLYWSGKQTEDGNPMIAINLSEHQDAASLWSTLTHEMGHLIADTALKRAPDKTKWAISNAYEVFRESIRPTERLASLQLRSLSAARIFEMNTLMGRGRRGQQGKQFGNLAKKEQEYWSNFDEWFAEQVSRWATTSDKPLTIVDKFFAGLAKRLRKLLAYVEDKVFGRSFLADATIARWLDEELGPKLDLSADFFADVTESGRKANQAALDAVGEGDGGAVHIDGASLGARNVFDNMTDLPDTAKRRARADAAHLDRLAWRHQMFFGLMELVERFKHIPALVAYKEDMQAQMLMQQVLTDEAEVVRKAWDKLGPTQNVALANVMDDFMNMSYRTPDEIKNGVARNPTRVEFQALMRQHGLDEDGAAVFKKIHGHFMHLFDVYEQVLLENIEKRGFSPEIALLKEAAINEQFNLLRSRPFTPLMHFGRHAVEVRDAAGNLIQREFYDNVKAANKAIFALNRKLPPGYQARPREFTKESLPFLNFPTAVQRAIAEQLELTEKQAEDLGVLREGDPVPIFRHQLMNRTGEKDFPHRLKRSFAWYSTRGATYIARLKFNLVLAGHIQQLRNEAKFMPDSRLRDGIANWLADHKKEQYSNRTDFAQLRAAGFFMYLGFMVPSAALNLTQAFFGTTPFLMAKFGPVAAAYILDAGSSRVAYYKKGTLEKLSEGDGRALDRAVKEKVVDESAAVELAGLSEGRNLTDRAGPLGPTISRNFVRFKHGSAYLFTMAEKLLRRNAFLSAYRLATTFPANPFVAESVRLAPQKFNQLVAEGWTRGEAAAYVTAQRTVEQTQYEYSRYAQPKFMRGVGRPLFMFKRFQHATMFMLYNHPKALIYWLPLTLFFGGLMGLPGMEDLRGISKWLASWLFGKDFDLETEARKFILEAFGGEKEILGREYFLPDLVTDGLSKYGFGIPHFLDMLGGTVGVDIPFPTLDRSRALGLGKIIPAPFDELAKADTRNENPEFKAIKEAAGPIFGWAFQAFAQARKIMQNPYMWKKPGDKGILPREWEPILPKILGRTSQAWRAYREQATTTPDGTPIVSYDTRDPEQAAEVIAKGLGYQTLKESVEYEQIRRQGEAIALWDTRRQMLLDQYWTAYQAKDPEEIKSVREAIIKFNTGLPKEVRTQRITFGKGGTIDRSIKGRQATRVKRAQDKALRKKDQSLIDEIKRLYPGSNPVSVQRLPGQ